MPTGWREYVYKTIIVEGLPGVGKTVFSAELARALGGNSLHLKEMDESSGNGYLADYYEDPARWAFTMQIHLLQSRLRSHLHAQYFVMSGRGDAVLDRSYFGDVAFAEVQRRLGFMSQREFDTYSNIYHNMTSFVLYPSVCVNLQAAPEVAMERIYQRMRIQTGRSCERKIDIGYLQMVGIATNIAVDALRKYGTHVINLDWNQSRETEADRHGPILDLANIIHAIAIRREFADIYTRAMD